MLPCTHIPPLDLGGVRVYPFAVLVAVGVVTTHWRSVQEAGRRGLRPELASRLGWVMVMGGFSGAWLFHMAYEPRLAPGIASFGGIFGGLMAGGLYLRHRGGELLRYMDGFALSFPIGWALGRAGCALVHDHLGRPGGWWFTVDCGAGARYDLGFIELIYISILAVVMALVHRSPNPPGFSLGLLLLLYGPFRVVLDRLHEDPPHWLFWSVDQWSGSVAALFGAGLLLRTLRSATAAALVEGEGLQKSNRNAVPPPSGPPKPVTP